MKVLLINSLLRRKEECMFLYKYSTTSTANSEAQILEDAGTHVPTGSGTNYLQKQYMILN